MKYLAAVVLMFAATMWAQGPGLPTGPVVPVLPLGCTAADATCVPLRAGDRPFDLLFSPPSGTVTTGDCAGNPMPGRSYAYPGVGDTQHLWCPATFAQLASLFQLVPQTGGVVWSQGDTVVMAPGTYPGNTNWPTVCNPTIVLGETGNETKCNLKLPPSLNPNNKQSYLMTAAYSSLPAPGNRVTTSDIPNMVTLPLNDPNLPMYGGAYTNYWHLVGLNVTSTSTQSPQTWPYLGKWLNGAAAQLVSFYGRGLFGQRDISATTGGTVDYLGHAASISATGATFQKLTPSSITVGTTGTIVLTAQNAHMCDNVTVTCSSVQGDSPTIFTAGYGVNINSLAVANVPCIAGMTGTCQTLTVNATITSDAASLPWQYSGPKTKPFGNLGLRSLIVRTERSSYGRPAEYLYGVDALTLTCASCPHVLSFQNLTHSGYPILPLCGAGTGVGTTCSSKPAQTYRVITENTTYLTAPGGITKTSVAVNGLTTLGVTTASATADTQIDGTITVPGGGYITDRALGIAVLGGSSGAAATPLSIAYNASGAPLVYLIPDSNLNSWIQSFDCANQIPGESYVCHAVGAHTSWTTSTVFSETFLSRPDGYPDVSISNVTVVDPTHATMTVTLTPDAGEGANHITVDRCIVGGVSPTQIKNILSDGSWLWEVDPTAPAAQNIASVFYAQGAYIALLDSRVHDGMTGVYGSGASESHLVVNLTGPGPILLRNNQFDGSSIGTFFGGSYNSDVYATDTAISDASFVHNYYWNDVNKYMALSVSQIMQSGANTPVTHYVATVDGGGSVTAITDATPVTGFHYCPSLASSSGNAELNLTGGGGSGAAFTCSVVDGQLVFTMTNGGTGYTTPPLLTLQFPGLWGLKNQAETKVGERVLYAGNIYSQAWGNSLLGQQGYNILLSPKAGTQGGPSSTLRNVTITGNWLDMGLSSLTLYANTDECFSAGTEGMLANSVQCSPPWDSAGSNPVPTTNVGGYVTGYAGAGLIGMRFDYNLITQRDVSDDLAFFPNQLVWSEFNTIGSSGVAFVSDTPTVNTVFNHNTFMQRPGYTVGIKKGWQSTLSGQATHPYTATAPFSVSWNRYSWDSVYYCQPVYTANGGVGYGFQFVQDAMACPTNSGDGSGQSCGTSTGTNYNQRYFGNVHFNETATCSDPAVHDWTNGGLSSNTATTTKPVFVDDGVGNYSPSQRPGNQTLVTPSFNGAQTHDGSMSGYSNTFLMQAIGQSSASSIPNVVTGLWTGSGVAYFPFLGH